jgi:hypothetical protein
MFIYLFIFLGRGIESLPQMKTGQYCGVSSSVPSCVPIESVHCVNRPNSPCNRGTWAKHEDEILIRTVARFGSKKWTEISKFVPSRTAKQCRERWFNRLDPSLKKEPFEPWEDNLIVERQRELGNRWARIAESLPGRNPDSVKNRWYITLEPMLQTRPAPDAA